MSENTLFYALGAGLLLLTAVSLSMAWQRGSKSSSALRDRQSADRARFASRVIEVEPVPARRGDKVQFGRR
jgi:hypothetical protein